MEVGLFMADIKWCLGQSKGIKLIEPTDHLSQEYIKEAENTLDDMLNNKGKWKIIMAYYACYNALYSILMKVGIKCEIHDCSIELMNEIEGFGNKDYEFMIALKEDRIQVQYYLKDKVLEEDSRVKSFILKCKTLLTDIDIDTVRNKLKEVSK